MKRFFLLLFLLFSTNVFAEKVEITVSKAIDPALLTEELMAQFPNSGIHSIEYDPDTKKLKMDFPNNVPSASSIQSVIDAHDKDKKANDRKKARNDALKKLKDVGINLTPEETDVLFSR